MQFHVAAIPPDFAGGDSLDFSPEAMLHTYELGLRLMREGNAWSYGWEAPVQLPEGVQSVEDVARAQEESAARERPR
jgi:hypothetical protein